MKKILLILSIVAISTISCNPEPPIGLGCDCTPYPKPDISLNEYVDLEDLYKYFFCDPTLIRSYVESQDTVQFYGYSLFPNKDGEILFGHDMWDGTYNGAQISGRILIHGITQDTALHNKINENVFKKAYIKGTLLGCHDIQWGYDNTFIFNITDAYWED